MNAPSTAAFTVSEVLNASWEITKKDWKKFALLFLIVLGIFVGYAVVSTVLNFVITIPNFVDQILSTLVGVYVSLILARGSLAIVRNHAFDLNTVLKLDSKMYLAALLAYILYTIVTIVGFFLLIIPGIIASIMFYFYIYSIVDKGTSAIVSLEDSMHMTSGNKWNIFGYNLVLGLIGAVVLGVPIAILAVLAFVSEGEMGILILVGILGMIVVVALAAVLTMVGMSGAAYMYNKMRAKTPLAIAK